MYRNKDRTPFYKYYSAETGLKVLAECRRKWSNPIEFNDPFDNQFDFYFEEPNDDVFDHLAKMFQGIFNSEYSVKISPELNQKLQTIQSYSRQIEGIDFAAFGETYKQQERLAIQEGVRNAERLLPSLQKDMKEILRDMSVFCVSEVYDNILMWSHYADCHRGIVVKFLALEDVDSPLLVAKPVAYKKEFPKLRYQDYYNIATLSQENGQGQAINEFLTLTKSELWSYEKEWRVVGGLRDTSKTSEILPFAPQEVDSIYLGCKMIEEDKQRIIALVREKFPSLKIYQAFKIAIKFELVFQEIAI